jgi:hypothetical protein
MTSLVLTNLLKCYCDDISIVNNITLVIQDPQNYEKHRNLRETIEKSKLHNTDAFKAYYNEFHEFMYKLSVVGKRWDRPGTDTLHCDKKVNGITLPARIDNDGELMWVQNGVYYRTDVDEYGNTLPVNITNYKKTWRNANSIHRSELGKNPNDLTTFGKAMPAIIYETGVMEWYFEGVSFTQEKLTQKILDITVIVKEEDDILMKLLKNFNDKPQIVKLVADVIGDKSKYEHHRELREYFENYSYLREDKLFLEYYDQYHEFMYKKSGSVRTWSKPSSCDEHCEKTFINADGLVETFPSSIDRDGTKYWRKNGWLSRSDVDKYGNRLPTQDGPNVKYWNENRKQHRAELGKNPNDLETYNKALPAIIYKDGNKEWKFEGNDITEAELTARLLGIPIPKPVMVVDDIAEIEITYANGDVRRDTHPIASIKIMKK